jgi:non-canonical (house-cleaning) NTP pyrophosphatase
LKRITVGAWGAIAFFAIGIECGVDNGGLGFFDFEFGANLVDTEEHSAVEAHGHSATRSTIAEATEAEATSAATLSITASALLWGLATFFVRG